jgi:hypothetical protein
LEQALAEMVASGRVTREVGYGAANNKEYFAGLVGMTSQP